jgi:membrane-bound lytic murein transglycosylase MltF
MQILKPILCLIALLAFLEPALVFGNTETENEPEATDLGIINKVFTGDYDQMVENRVIRVLMPYSKTFFFFDGAQPKGASYELIQQFEAFLNEKLKTKHLKLHALVIPTQRDQLLPHLVEGKGDIAVGNLTITEERLQDVAFSDPLASGVDEILVSGADKQSFKSIFDLSGLKIHVRKSSSYYESLVRLNETLRSLKKKEVIIAEADENLEDEDLLEMVNAGLLDYMVIDNHKGEFWAQIFDQIKLHPEIKLRTEGKIAWAMRKNSPQLAKVVNEFIRNHKQGTLLGNTILNRYLKDASYITNSVYKEDLQRFKLTIQFFKKYGQQYQFDHLMLAALAYQESRLDQNLKSPAGAVGVMQILPSTAKDKNVDIPDIHELDKNIHAGAKYLRFMVDNYFANDPGLDELNKTLFAFASYNAGPARVAKLRKEAEQMGLDPNIWFRNVEVVAAKRIGRETVQYVSNIFKYYVSYKLLEDKILSEAEGPAHLSGPSKKKKK